MTTRIRVVTVIVGLLISVLATHRAGNRGHFDPTAQQVVAKEDWRQAVTAQIAREEYSITSGHEGLRAPNRAHNLHTTFHDRGFEVVPREDDAAPAWRFAWRTSGFGRLGALREVEGATIEPSGSRVTYRRSDLDEWYDNSSDGLEQGFTIHAPPTGEGPVCIAGRLEGSLRSELRAEEGAVDLLDEEGIRALRYGELHVWDATGEEVPSRLSLDGVELAIVIEDHGSVYPLTVDPLMTSPAWIAESNQVLAQIGYSVAAAGDVNGDGYSDVIVGAPGYDNDLIGEGRAFVYHGSAAGLSTTPAWIAEGDQSFANLGISVATAGDVNGDGFSDVIVGASSYDNGEGLEGRAFVYHGSPTGLNTTPAWTAEGDQELAGFGEPVASAGDVNDDGFSDVIVGASGYGNGQDGEGRAFVYHGSAAGLLATPAWTAESDQEFAGFGTAVATAGEVNGDGFSDVIVGARWYDNGEFDEGRAFVYHGSAAGLATTAAWTAEINVIRASFGYSLATAGDVNGDGFSDVIVGAEGTSATSNEIGAFVFHGSAAGLAPMPAWTTESGQGGGQAFGYSVATAGDVNHDGFSDVIVSNSVFDNDQEDEGRSFAFEGSVDGLATTPVWTAESDQSGSEFGYAVASAGDVNGDGFSDVIVGARLYDNGQSNEGRVLVYHGSATIGIGAAEGPRASLLLEAPQPNPFGHYASIGYKLPRSGGVRLAVYDVTGRERALLVEGRQAAGPQAITWDGRDAHGTVLPAGVYIVRLTFDGRIETHKIVRAP